ncbi:hypothetical protein H0H81_009394, partial [Sphagnurus paluster]
MLNPTSGLEDTPLRSATSTSFMRTRSYARQGYDATEETLPFLRYAATNDFLGKIFHHVTASSADAVLKKLIDSGHYCPIKKIWAEFPTNETKFVEKDLYLPFVAAANAIASHFKGRWDRKALWLDRHSRAPRSDDKESAPVCPDCSLVSTSEADAWEFDELDRDIRELKLKLGSEVKTSEKKKIKDKLSGKECRRRKLAEKLVLAWRHHHVAVEFKLKMTLSKNEERYPAIVKQCLTYMRRTLSEQPDRRFIFGLAIHYDQMSILLSDRSGTLLTVTSINISTEPLKFIRVIGSLSLMSPEELGWDTGMRLYVPIDNGEQMPSYEVAHDPKHDRYTRAWVIDVMIDEKLKQYVSVRVLSMLRAAEMVGRATVVYEVVKYEERFHPKK